MKSTLLVQEKPAVDILKNPVGVVIARFQVEELHPAQLDLLNYVVGKHPKVLIFLGVSQSPPDRKNPLDYVSRMVMIKNLFPGSQVVTLPLKDEESDSDWSSTIDNNIHLVYGSLGSVLYGSRDSFIPHYRGKYPTIELDTVGPEMSGTESRAKTSTIVRDTVDFRAGVIYSVYARYSQTSMCVDVVALNERGQLLLGKRSNQPLFRFFGGHVDRKDRNLEISAEREFREETGGKSKVTDLKYICSSEIDDWRYRGSADGIKSVLFLGKYDGNEVSPSDDMDGEVKWLDIPPMDGKLELWLNTNIMPEHRGMMGTLIYKFHSPEFRPVIVRMHPNFHCNSIDYFYKDLSVHH